MTESSSAGHPDGAALPADHPLGPAVPVPPRDREGEAAPSTAGHGDASPAGADRPDAAAGTPGPGHAAPDTDAVGHDDGRPEADRREEVLDPSAGTSGRHAASIRDEQGTHSAGTVPAAFNGDGIPEDPAENRHPEDAASEPDRWDSGGAPD